MPKVYSYERNGEQWKLTEAQVEKFKAAGQWPPPPGIVVLSRREPSGVRVLKRLRELASIVPPDERKAVERAAKAIKVELNAEAGSPSTK